MVPLRFYNGIVGFYRDSGTCRPYKGDIVRVRRGRNVSGGLENVMGKGGVSK